MSARKPKEFNFDDAGSDGSNSSGSGKQSPIKTEPEVIDTTKPKLQTGEFKSKMADAMLKKIEAHIDEDTPKAEPEVEAPKL